MVIGSLNHGGAERVSATLANYWAEQGWQVTIVTLGGMQGDFYQLHSNVHRRGLDLVAVSRGSIGGLWNNLLRVRALRAALMQERPEIIMAFMTTSNILTAFAVMGTDLVAVGSEHIYPPKHTLGRIWRCLRRLMYPRLAFVSALTQGSASWLKVHTRARHIPVVPNPVAFPLSVQAPECDPAALSAQLGGKHWLLAAGRLVDQKGFDRLIAAYEQIAQEYPNWRLILLGEGPLRQALEQQIAECGLKDRVSLPGAMGNIGAWYEAADLYAMTSRYEGFGNTLAEALAYGLPAVAMDCETGPGEILRHEIDGLLVADNDMTGLVQALRRLMTDDSLRQRFAVKAVEARQRFSVEKVAALWEHLFAEVLQ